MTRRASLIPLSLALALAACAPPDGRAELKLSMGGVDLDANRTIDLGAVSTSEGLEQILSLHNEGTATLTITGLRASEPSAITFPGWQQTASLAPGESMDVPVLVQPQTHQDPPIEIEVQTANLGSSTFSAEYETTIGQLNAPTTPTSDPQPGPEGLAKLDGGLSQIAQATLDGVARPANAAAAFDGDRIRVSVRVEAGQEAAAQAQIEAAGGAIDHSTSGQLQAWIPEDRLVDVANSDAIGIIELPSMAHPMALESAPATGQAAWHSDGHTGAGVKVGVIDLGFDGYGAQLGTGLPSSVTTRNFIPVTPSATFTAGSGHGTAVAEIVHAVAPDAELYLAQINTAADFDEAADWLTTTQNVQVINTSLGFLAADAGDGSGFVAGVVNDAIADGAMWVTSAGNHRRQHWIGNTDFSGGFHRWSGSSNLNFFGGSGTSNAYCLPAGFPISAFLRWSDWTDKDQDYRLHIVRRTLTAGAPVDAIVATSDLPQSGASFHEPREAVRYVTTTACSVSNQVVYAVAVERTSGSRTTTLDLFTSLEVINTVAGRSLASPADVEDAVSVAAVDAVNTGTAEPYSSVGPSLGLGGVATGGSMSPDIAGYANVTTSAYSGTQKFNGTSAAAPHVAGAAAVVLGADGDLSLEQALDLLLDRSVDIGPAGYDNEFGEGRLNLGAVLVGIDSVSLTSPTPGSVASLTAYGTYEFSATLGPAGLTEPLEIDWSASGAPDALMTAPDDASIQVRWNTPGTYTVEVTANNPGAPAITASVDVEVTALGVDIAPGSCADGKPGTTLTLSGTSSASTYGVYRSTDLRNWTLADGQIAGTDGTTTWTDCGGAGWDPASERGFYVAAIEDDPDQDGLSTGYESLLTKTDPWVADSDGDGIDDGDENSDSDGLSDGEELSLPGSIYAGACRTGSPRPTDADSDDDGVDDDLDAFPLDSGAFSDSDCDGRPDVLVGPSTSRPALIPE